jgi:hypothetical protein
MSMMAEWQKSSFSEGEGPQCVEVARLDDMIGMRESDAPEVMVTVDPVRLRALLIGIKTGVFAHVN